jgi:DNA repair protein RecO (recombination protein O)
MHPIYHTEALILASYPKGEANVAYLLLTKDMGVFYAVAQGVRLEKSKLRYSLQDFSFARIDLVRGKDVWRITSATILETFPQVYKTEQGMRFLAHTAKLIKRLVRGEVSHPSLLPDTLTALRFFNQPTIDPALYTPVSFVLFLRILRELGYVPQKPEISPYLSEVFIPENIDPVTFPKKLFLEEIHQALVESQL